jgi:predicted  nucleic acid-binding Zn-ribbon protein
MIDWPVVLSAVSQAIKLARDLSSIDKEISQADLKLKIADLTETLATIKLAMTEAKTDAAEKDEEIARLKTLQKRVVEGTVEIRGYRYRNRTDGKEGGRWQSILRCVFSKGRFAN